ncbi:sensor histidine kinase NtrY-like [Falsiroseomonas tokyonensis]|uniref:histidine kinase n=1 Tax=Falsiroseomonas tokyonensis TaxID=430521 RepID=A0ABV7BW12_9PROT|nr:PAS domain-containing sensor histidine kinase [Falsiroseomonas tokyonensis]MBU8538228.1 PAS domain-containing sensor histidine kinase [Falsiroseomonas tokyonensis]
MSATFTRRLSDILLGRATTLGLAVTAVLLGVATFVLLAGGSPFGPTSPGQIVAVVLCNAGVLLLLAGSLASRLVRVWAERRRGSAGARLHVRLVLLFGGVAVVPALIVAAFAAIFFNLGIQAWFSDRVRSTLEASLVASRAWMDQHRDEIRVDALAMAADLNRAAQVFLPDNMPAFERLLATQTSIRGLTEAVVFEPTLGRVMAAAGFTPGAMIEPPPGWALEQVRQGEVAVVPGESDARVRAVTSLDIPPGLLLLIGRPLDGSVLDHMRTTELAFQEYDQLDRNRGSLQITFAMIFACAALLVLLAAVLVGLVFANQMARPISRLITAAERVRAGDLATRVEEGTQDDELASLSRAFNRMTSQLSAQRGELMEAYRQIDERRRFTETVLSGVSAGVVGLDAEGRINLPNRTASELLGVDLDAAIGLPLAGVAPEFAALVAEARGQPDRVRTAEIPIGPPSHRRSLIARIGAEGQPGRVAGFVLTFDDITELQSAQRKAAWADVARRIAHEIKNPLTPIMLSAERLKRKYLKEIGSDPETFRTLTDTIVRQVGDIGRMVDEFSAFARMPQPVIRPDRLDQVVREALVLQQGAHPDIRYETTIPEDLPPLPMDRRLIGQALTNLLQNAADAVASAHREEGEPGRITLRVEPREEGFAVVVEDNGIGLPDGEERARLTEPYVTHKAKGTGLGLAIVKKIMEDHGGRLELEDRSEGPGARALLILPRVAPSDSKDSGPLQVQVREETPVMGASAGRGDGAG